MDDRPVFTVVGSLEMKTASRIEAELHEHSDRNPGPVYVDCSEMTFIDSAGLRVFVNASRELAEVARPLVIEGVPEQCYRAIQACGLMVLFGIRPRD